MSFQELGKVHREPLERELRTSFNATMDLLEECWQIFGLNEECVIGRSNTVLKHIKLLLNDLLKEEQDLMMSIQNRIKNDESQLRQICEEMSEEFKQPEANLPLLLKEKFLRTQLDELMNKKKIRMDKYKELRRQEGKLCETLAMPQTPPVSSSVPSERELYELEQHIQMLHDEKERRYHKYCHAKKQLSTILEETDFCPETSFEREVICYDDDEDFILSQEKLDQLKLIIEKVQKVRDEMIMDIKRLSKKLHELWDRLDVDRKIREEFTEKYSEIRQSTLLALKKEIERWEEERKQNISQYISKLREELILLWEKCYISADERENFVPFYSQDYTEDLLEAHEIEVNRLKKYYEEAKGIFIKIAKYDELWKLMIVLDRKSQEPNRFNNRGGNLLQEEKQRNKLVKDLPKLEKEILSDISKYEEHNQTMFLIDGINFAEFLDKQWTEFHAKKENRKMERQRQRSEKYDSVYTPNKRFVCHTPSSAPSKLVNKALSASKSGKFLLTPKTVNTMTPSQVLKKSVLATKRLSPRRANSKTPSKCMFMERNWNYLGNKNTLDVPSASHDTTSYKDFAKELDRSSRDRCRSSTKTRVFASKLNGSGSLKSRYSFNSSGRTYNSSKTLLRSNNKSIRNTSRTPTKLTSARAKMGLPFLI